MRHPLLLTKLDALGNQRIACGLISMFSARDNLSGDPDPPCVPEHYEPDKLPAVIGSDHVLSKQKARKLVFHRFKVLAIMPESPSLPNRRLVEDCGHPPHEVVVEGCF